MAVNYGTREVHTITLDNGRISLKANCTHYPYQPGSRVDPPEPERLEIETVFYKNVDVTDLVNEINPEFLYEQSVKITEGR